MDSYWLYRKYQKKYQRKQRIKKVVQETVAGVSLVGILVIIALVGGM